MKSRLPRKLDRASFDCGEPALNEFLRRHARQSHDKGAAKTFLAISQSDGKTILGFYSLCPASLEYARAPEIVRKGLARHEIPAFRLGRLAVNRPVQGQGLGGQLILAAGRRCLLAATEVGGVRSSSTPRMSGRRNGTHPTVRSRWRIRRFPCYCHSQPSNTCSKPPGNAEASFWWDRVQCRSALPVSLASPGSPHPDPLPKRGEGDRLSPSRRKASMAEAFRLQHLAPFGERSAEGRVRGTASGATQAGDDGRASRPGQDQLFITPASPYLGFRRPFIPSRCVRRSLATARRPAKSAVVDQGQRGCGFTAAARIS